MSYDLEIAKTVNVAEASIGDEITYTILYTNNGPATVYNVVIQDIYPSEILSFDSSDPTYDLNDGDVYTWNIGILNPGQTGMIVITGTVLDNIS